MKISVIIPAFNEQEYIYKTIDAVLQWTKTAEIIVIDDGSTDNTGEILRNLENIYPIKIVFHQKNLGKGQALMTGINYANGDIILFLDADLGDSAKFACKLIDPILNIEADMTVAILPKTNKKAGFGLVKKLAGTGIYLMTGFKMSSPLSGQRAVKREIVEQIPFLEKGFGIEVGLTIDVLRRGFRIKEVEVPLKHRETGRDIAGFIHRGKEFTAVLKALFYKWRQKVLW